MKYQSAVVAMMAIGLSGCGGSGSSDPSVASRDVTLGFSVQGQEQPFTSAQNSAAPSVQTLNNWPHTLQKSGYQLCYNHEALVEEYCEPVADISEMTSLVIHDVRGDLSVRVFHPELDSLYGAQNEAKINTAYNVHGEMVLPASEDSGALSLTNDGWSFVTLDDSEDILADEDLSDDLQPHAWLELSDGSTEYLVRTPTEDGQGYNNDFSYQYVRNDSFTMHIEIQGGVTLNSYPVSAVEDKHYVFVVKMSDRDGQIGVGIEDSWEDPSGICLGDDCYPADPIAPFHTTDGVTWRTSGGKPEFIISNAGTIEIDYSDFQPVQLNETFFWMEYTIDADPGYQWQAIFPVADDTEQGTLVYDFDTTDWTLNLGESSLQFDDQDDMAVVIDDSIMLVDDGRIEFTKPASGQYLLQVQYMYITERW